MFRVNDNQLRCLHWPQPPHNQINSQEYGMGELHAQRMRSHCSLVMRLPVSVSKFNGSNLGYLIAVFPKFTKPNKRATEKQQRRKFFSSSKLFESLCVHMLFFIILCSRMKFLWFALNDTSYILRLLFVLHMRVLVPKIVIVQLVSGVFLIYLLSGVIPSKKSDAQ